MDKAESIKKALHDLYDSARNAGACHTVKEFAALIGRNYSSVSAAMNGNPKECNLNLVTIANTKLISLGIIRKAIVPENSDSESSMSSAMSSLIASMESNQKRIDEQSANSDLIMSELLRETRRTNMLLEKILEHISDNQI